MNIQDAIRFANENPICFLATAEDEQPRVRALGFWFADETGFYFQTGEVKEMVNQIRNNPNIEVCFYKPGPNAGETLRVAGKAEFVTDIELKKKCLVDRPFLKMMGIDFDSPALIIFRIAKGKANYWNWEVNLKPKEYITFG
ncbi:MAG: pyridoxamine 5'-phosphate oxidase family protein [Bacteroidota bacterium]|nr:pyridoxamine 5'-phosphate oxidase family protein [Bacteroidota bacterium]